MLTALKKSTLQPIQILCGYVKRFVRRSRDKERTNKHKESL